MAGQDNTLRVFLRQRNALVRYAANLTGDRSEAEDLVQEAWLRFDAVASHRPLAEPQGYLHRIVRNLVMDGRRRRGVEQRLFDADAGDLIHAVPGDQPSAEAQVAAREELEIIRATLAAMPDRMRQAFEMHRFQGMTLVEIAARLSISKSTTQELVVDGVERCRRALKGHR
jgi:RNA polymerase sigma factor (sigma-70 family)